MKPKMIVLGAGPHAHSVLDIALSVGEYEVIGCLDPNYPQATTVAGFPDIPIIGRDEDLEKFFNQGVKYVFVALGDNSIRSKLYHKSLSIGFIGTNLISPHAVVSSRAKLGNGICIMAGAIVNACAVIQDNVILNTSCSVDHDCKIEKSCHIAPGVTLSGDVNVGEGTWIGTGASVIHKISIGTWSFIGAGAVVVNDIGDHSLCVGVPAKHIRST